MNRSRSSLQQCGYNVRMPRRPSEKALAEVTGKVCEECLSRCVTHDSLTKLDELVEDDDSEIDAILSGGAPSDEATATAEATATTALEAASAGSSSSVEWPHGGCCA